jgi:hypothetical protein
MARKKKIIIIAIGSIGGKIVSERLNEKLIAVLSHYPKTIN